MDVLSSRVESLETSGTESIAAFGIADSPYLEGRSTTPVESQRHPRLVTTEPPLSHSSAPVESQMTL